MSCPHHFGWYCSAWSSLLPPSVVTVCMHSLRWVELSHWLGSAGSMVLYAQPQQAQPLGSQHAPLQVRSLSAAGHAVLVISGKPHGTCSSPDKKGAQQLIEVRAIPTLLLLRSLRGLHHCHGGPRPVIARAYYPHPLADRCDHMGPARLIRPLA